MLRKKVAILIIHKDTIDSLLYNKTVIVIKKTD